VHHAQAQLHNTMCIFDVHLQSSAHLFSTTHRVPRSIAAMADMCWSTEMSANQLLWFFACAQVDPIEVSRCLQERALSAL
jgi:hypothetical protein